MEYFLGIIAGLVIATFILSVLLYFRPSIDRTIRQVASKVKKGGEIIEPEDEELKNWVDNLKIE